FKAQFLSPLAMMAATADLKAEIAEEINEKLHEDQLTVSEVDSALENIFHDLLDIDEGGPPAGYQLYRKSCVLAENGYFRTDFTSKLVNLFMQGIELHQNTEYPQLSVVKFNIATFKMVEILKKFAYKSLILSPRLKIAESRGRD